MRRWALAVLVAAGTVGAAGCVVVAGPGYARPAVVVGLPRFALIAGTQISYAPGEGKDFFRCGGVYYWHNGGKWYRRSVWGDPWVPITVVPDAFLRIPANHAKYHVVKAHPKFVRHPGRPF